MRLSRHPALVMFASIALFVAGAGTVVYGFGTLAYDVPVAETAAAFGIGLALVAGSVALAVATERQLRRDEALQKALAATSSPASSSPAAKTRPKRDRAAADVQPDRVLAEWTLAPDEWRAYNQVEALEKRRSVVFNTVFGAAFGTMAPWVITGHWRYSAIAAPLLAGVVLVYTLVSAARIRKRAPRAGGHVVVRRNTVEIDGEAGVLRDGTWWLSAVKVREDLPLPVMELSVKKTTYERGGSRRTMEEVVRVPVPRGREAQAARVADQLRRGIPDADDDG